MLYPFGIHGFSFIKCLKFEKAMFSWGIFRKAMQSISRPKPEVCESKASKGKSGKKPSKVFLSSKQLR